MLRIKGYKILRERGENGSEETSTRFPEKMSQNVTDIHIIDRDIDQRSNYFSGSAPPETAFPAMIPENKKRIINKETP